MVSGLLSFSAGLETSSTAKQNQLSKVETLRICHTPDIINPSYSRLMADSRKWKATGSRFWNEEDDEDLECALETDWYVRFDADEALKAALRMRGAIRNGMNVMPSLKRVVMMGVVDNERNIEEQYVAKGMGDVLLSLPSVEYYCQSSALGPLSMSNTISQPLHPPRIATFHLSRSSKIWKSFLYCIHPLLSGRSIDTSSPEVFDSSPLGLSSPPISPPNSPTPCSLSSICSA